MGDQGGTTLGLDHRRNKGRMKATHTEGNMWYAVRNNVLDDARRLYYDIGFGL